MVLPKMFLSLVVVSTLLASTSSSLLQTNEEMPAAMNIVTESTSLYPSDTLNLVTLGLINGKKYLFVDQDGSWFDASYFCNIHGMDLAVIESQQENDLIKEHIADLGKTSTIFWVGGHKLGRASYQWITGVSMIFSDWGPGEPANPSTEHCMGVRYNYWTDYVCNDATSSTAFICEERVAA